MRLQRGPSVSLDFTHLARPQVRNLSQLSLGSLALDQLGISGQRDEVGLKPHGHSFGTPDWAKPEPPTLECAATVPLTVMAEWLCPGLWTPDVWSYVPTPQLQSVWGTAGG